MSAEVTVTGRIVNPAGAAVSVATVMISSLSRSLLLIPEPVHPDGTFSVTIDGKRGDALRCEASAPGYSTESRNFEIDSETQSIGTIVLKRAAELKMGDVVLEQSGNQEEDYLDFFLSNESEVTSEVRAIQVVGSATSKTGCLDYAPALSLDVKTLTPGGKLSTVEISDNQTKTIDSISAKGGAEILPCGQCRIDLMVPILVRMAPHEQRKLRLSLPRSLHAKGRTCIPIDTWASLVVRVIKSTGDNISTVVH